MGVGWEWWEWGVFIFIKYGGTMVGEFISAVGVVGVVSYVPPLCEKDTSMSTKER